MRKVLGAALTALRCPQRRWPWLHRPRMPARWIGMRSRTANPAATGPPTPATGSTAACSSCRPPGANTAVLARRHKRHVSTRSWSPNGSFARRGSALARLRRFRPFPEVVGSCRYRQRMPPRVRGRVGRRRQPQPDGVDEPSSRGSGHRRWGHDLGASVFQRISKPWLPASPPSNVVGRGRTDPRITANRCLSLPIR